MSESFSAGKVAYLRAAILPRDHADIVDPRLDAYDERSALTGVLRAASADPLVREALEVSSDSLAGTLRRVEQGAELPIRSLRRAAYAAYRYLLRMTGRPTPFGLMAGVAVAGFGARARVDFGADHGKGVRPDGDWLGAVVGDLESRADVVRCLRLCANDLHEERGGRFVLPYAPAQKAVDQRTSEKSVRATAPVRIAMAAAREPIAFAALVERVSARYKDVDPARIETMVMNLVDCGLLCTELSPPQHCTDPLAYVLSILDRTRAAETVALRRMSTLLREYAEASFGSGRSAWSAATAVAGELRATDATPLQVDTRLDVRVTLPEVVAREAESAAAALVRLSPASGSLPHLVGFHEEFVDRYGIDRVVPVKEVLDPERGIGPPAGYRLPAQSRLPEPATERDTRREQRVGALVQAALLSGTSEIVLDEKAIAELEPKEQPAPLPATAEVAFQLLANSPAALDDGDFRLVWAPAAGMVGGAVFGRFAYLFDKGALAAAMPAATGDLLRVQVGFQPAGGRLSNLTRVPAVLDRQLEIGGFAERTDQSVLSLDDIGVAADRAGLRLISLRDQRPLTALAPHMLDPIYRTPNAARLIREIGTDGTRKLRPWAWGDTECLPYLPRVRYGRAVIAQARWRPPPGDLASERALEQWRDQFGVPDVVQARYADNTIELDLTVPLHRRLLADELRRKPDLVLTETCRRADTDFDWLAGHANEIVVSLSAPRKPDGQVRTRSQPASVRQVVPPGGNWVFAKLYCAAERQPEVLRNHLPRLLAAAPSTVDRWFFVRYLDPDQHLRIRLHGEPDALNRLLLPALHSWAADLRSAGLARKVVLDTYEPETDRYGGAAVLEAAERAFRADSEAVLTQLSLSWSGDVDVSDDVLAAVNFVDLLQCCDPLWYSWYSAVEVKHYPGMHADVRKATELRDDRLLDVFKQRAPAVRHYAELVRGQPDHYREAVNSLLHMHHNRLVGTDRTAEERAHAIASRVAAAYRGRLKAGRG